MKIFIPVALVLSMAGNAAGQLLQFVDNPALGTFIDIVDSGGQQLIVGQDGEAEIPLSGFAGNFVILRGMVVAGQNGGVGFGQQTVSNLAALNELLPSLNAFLGTQATLVFWDDIDDKEGDLHFLQLINDPVHGTRLIIQWEFANFDGTGATLKLQVQIPDNFEATGIYAQYLYQIQGPSSGAGASATIGYQGGKSGFGYVQYSYETPNAVADGTVLSLMIPAVGDLDLDGLVGLPDFMGLLAEWGPCADCQNCPADLNGDCRVGITDMFVLFGNWS